MLFGSGQYHAIGGVLFQKSYSIAYEIRKLDKVEKQYSIHKKKKLLSMAHCLQIWRIYLLGINFVAWTDNVSTIFFKI